MNERSVDSEAEAPDTRVPCVAQAEAYPYVAAWSLLLPLRKLAITLQFTRKSSGAFFHYAPLYAFLQNLTGLPTEELTRVTRIDACETGRIGYNKGDFYRFSVNLLGDNTIVLDALLNGVRRLPLTEIGRDALLGSNVRFVDARCGFTERALHVADDAGVYDLATLQEEAVLWRDARQLKVRFVSPVRWRRDKADSHQAKGELRFC